MKIMKIAPDSSLMHFVVRLTQDEIFIEMFNSIHIRTI